MARPYVKLQSENKCEELLGHVGRNLDRFLAFQGLIDILLSGGLSRGYADHLSEIDLTILLKREHFERYQREKTPVPTGIAVIDGQLYDTKLENYDDALCREYAMAALWDLSYAQILYDPEEKLAALLQAKLSQPVDLSLAERFLFEAWWHYRLAGNIWLHRNDAAQGHFVLNNAVRPLLSALFVSNGEYVPHDKWLVHLSRTLGWKPEGWEEDLETALSTGAFDSGSLSARQGAIDRLWSAIDAKLREKSGSRVSMMQKHFYDLLSTLAVRGSVPLSEWAEAGGMGLLNSEPFHSCVEVRDGQIFLDTDRFLALRPDDMYSWFYEVVEAVRSSRF